MAERKSKQADTGDRQHRLRERLQLCAANHTAQRRAQLDLRPGKETADTERQHERKEHKARGCFERFRNNVKHNDGVLVKQFSIEKSERVVLFWKIAEQHYFGDTIE